MKRLQFSSTGVVLQGQTNFGDRKMIRNTGSVRAGLWAGLPERGFTMLNYNRVAGLFLLTGSNMKGDCYEV